MSEDKDAIRATIRDLKAQQSQLHQDAIEYEKDGMKQSAEIARREARNLEQQIRTAEDML